MAVVMLALNGVGLGHLIRSTLVSQALASVGERPVIFSQGNYQTKKSAQFPSRQIPSLWRAPDRVRKQVASDLYSMAGISLPAVVVEDTHPNPIQLPAEVRRVLLVRPPFFEYLLHLNEKYGPTYSAYLLCDSPDSPTWPYDEEQTRQLAGWKAWHIVGPIYRTPSEDDIREVRMRYRLSEDQELCVFTMGGGGLQNPDDQDIARFLKLASEVADVVQPPGSDARVLFVKGPYFPPGIGIPSRFEIVADEEQMPALLKLAKGAVMRVGNTTWECLAAGTPFIPLIGTTFEEPVQKRVNNLTVLGLIPQSIEQFWYDNKWRSEFRRIAQGVVARHTGSPNPLELQRLILDRPAEPVPPKLKASVIRAIEGKRQIPFVIRIDDVVCKEPTFCWLLELLAARGLRASLEVVPYLLEFEEQFLERFDPAHALFEVSQHGYAHVPRASASSRHCEFSTESVEPSAHEVEWIAKGKRQIETAFSKRFTGGFSEPYDALPHWLPGAWRELGGTFVSYITNPAPDAPLPVTRAGVDVWDWTRARAITRSRMKRELAQQLAANGYAGIVLHPRCLRHESEKSRLVDLLDYVERSGAVTVSLRDCALGKVELANPQPQGWGSRLRTWFVGKRTGFLL